MCVCVCVCSVCIFIYICTYMCVTVHMCEHACIWLYGGEIHIICYIYMYWCKHYDSNCCGSTDEAILHIMEGCFHVVKPLKCCQNLMKVVAF